MDANPDEISEFFNKIDGKYGDKKEQLKLLRLFNFLIKENDELFAKIAHYNI